MDNLISVIAKPLKVGIASFFVSLVAAVAAFNIDYQADNFFAYFFFWLMMAAVAIGFASIVWGIWAAVQSAKQKN